MPRPASQKKAPPTTRTQPNLSAPLLQGFPLSSPLSSWPILAVLGGLAVLVLAFIFPLREIPWEWPRFGGSAKLWHDRRELVKDAFVTSWDAYTKYAWGESQSLILSFLRLFSCLYFPVFLISNI
jgi:endoplasmic reticulum Man9GlcNAc2 1,2-alpha-mannosidase